MNRCTQNLRALNRWRLPSLALLATALISSAVCAAGNPNDPNNDHRLLEVRVLDFKVNNGSSGMIEFACVDVGQCRRMNVALDHQSALADNGASVSLKEAAGLMWRYAIVVYDADGQLSYINRVPKLY